MHTKFNALEISRDNNKYFAYLGLCEFALPILNAEKQQFLSSTELELYSGLIHAKRQYSYLLGRKCAKDILHHYFNAHAKQITIANGVFGQPLIISETINQLGISISHHDNVGAVIIYPTTHPMGVDIEGIDVDKLQTAAQYLTSHELFIIKTHQQIPSLPLIFWSAREAAAKVLTCGIGVPNHIFEIKDIFVQDDALCISFNNFFQLRVYSKIIAEKYILSIALPSNSILDITNI
jgi:4'-phosphopantetheinyl transferase